MRKPPPRPLHKVHEDVFNIQRNPTYKRIHPMERPPALIGWFLNISSVIGEHVYDPFSGSFVVPDQCLRNNRACTAFEMEKDYYDRGMARIASTRMQLDGLRRASGK